MEEIAKKLVESEGLRLNIGEREKYESLTAATRILVDILKGPGPARASDAADRAHALFDASLRTNAPAKEPDCRKGCGYCCRVYVSATAPEVFAIARAVDALPEGRREELLARIRAADKATAGRDWSREPFFTHQCPLLDADSSCSLHFHRPDACRGVSSYSVEACKRSLAALAAEQDIAIPRVWEHSVLRAVHGHVLWAALRAAGLPHVQYSLNQALQRVADTPGAEARWLAGEDVFAGVPRDATVDDLPQAAVNATLDSLVAGAAADAQS